MSFYLPALEYFAHEGKGDKKLAFFKPVVSVSSRFKMVSNPFSSFIDKLISQVPSLLQMKIQRETLWKYSGVLRVDLFLIVNHQKSR